LVRSDLLFLGRVKNEAFSLCFSCPICLYFHVNFAFLLVFGNVIGLLLWFLWISLWLSNLRKFWGSNIKDMDKVFDKKTKRKNVVYLMVSLTLLLLCFFHLWPNKSLPPSRVDCQHFCFHPSHFFSSWCISKLVLIKNKAIWYVRSVDYLVCLWFFDRYDNIVLGVLYMVIYDSFVFLFDFCDLVC